MQLGNVNLKTVINCIDIIEKEETYLCVSLSSTKLKKFDIIFYISLQKS